MNSYAFNRCALEVLLSPGMIQLLLYTCKHLRRKFFFLFLFFFFFWPSKCGNPIPESLKEVYLSLNKTNNSSSNANGRQYKISFLDVFTLKAPNKNCSRQHFIFFHFYLSKKRRLDVSCESSVGQRIHLKYQVVFSLKTGKEKVLKTVVCCSCDRRIRSEQQRQDTFNGFHVCNREV